MNHYARIDYQRLKDLEDYAKRLGFILYGTQTEETMEDYPRLTLTFKQGFLPESDERLEESLASGSCYTPSPYTTWTPQAFRNDVKLELFENALTHVGSLVDIPEPRFIHELSPEQIDDCKALSALQV